MNFASVSARVLSIKAPGAGSGQAARGGWPGDLNKPLSNQNLITWKDTPVYNAPTTAARLRHVKRQSALSDPEQAERPSEPDLVSDPHR
jgi:hypothetical protein